MIEWLSSFDFAIADIIAFTAFIGLAFVGSIFFAWLSIHQRNQTGINERLGMVTGYQAMGKNAGSSENVFRDEKDQHFLWKKVMAFVETRTALAGGRELAIRVIVFSSFGSAILIGLLSVYFGIGFLNGIGLFAGTAPAVTVSIIHFRAGQAVKSFYNYFPDALEIISRGARAGVPVAEGIRSIGEEIPAPIGPVFARIADRLKIGVDLAPALEGGIREIDLPELRFFSVTLLLQRETGGQLAETLDNLSQLLRDRNLLKKKVKATTSEVRVSASIISAIPFLFGLYLYMTNKDGFFFFFENSTGQLMLQYMAGSLLVGILCIYMLMKSVR
ncbi:MAG: type II secretion system F family protein [Sneathiella sp.]|nr:type II secretion system F family protein [Sneathiella sp.]